MTTAYIVQYTDPKSEAAEYITEGRIRSQPGLDQLCDLLYYLQDTYPEDDALRIIEWRASAARCRRSAARSASDKGILKAERSRVERWARHLDGKPDPAGQDVREPCR